MNNQMDPYKLLELPKNFTLEQLRSNYKRLALQLHPDKGNIQTDYLFKMLTVAYKTLLKEYQAKLADKQYFDLRSDSKKTIETQRSDKYVMPELAVGSGQNFDTRKFNAIFENYRINEVHDDGYGSWMKPSDGKRREDINIKNKIGKFNHNRFNQAFENQPVARENKQVQVYREPEAVLSNKKMAFAELGVSKVDDFSGDNLTNKHLQYTDYKVAHTTTRLVDPNIKVREDFHNVEDLKSRRASVRYQMTDEEAREYARRKAKEEQQERMRQQYQQKYDHIAFQNYEKLNKILLK
jgi:curved DNA-binding protein CbpA